MKTKWRWRDNSTKTIKISIFVEPNEKMQLPLHDEKSIFEKSDSCNNKWDELLFPLISKMLTKSQQNAAML